MRSRTTLPYPEPPQHSLSGTKAHHLRRSASYGQCTRCINLLRHLSPGHSTAQGGKGPKEDDSGNKKNKGPRNPPYYLPYYIAQVATSTSIPRPRDSSLVV